jgi:hypothetical protein
VFLLDSDAAVPRRLVDVDGRAVEAFRARLRDAGVLVRLFIDVGDLAGEVVVASCGATIMRRPARGHRDEVVRLTGKRDPPMSAAGLPTQ